MGTMASQITSLTIVYSTGYSMRKSKKSSASLVCVRGINRWLVNSPHKGPVERKMSLFDDVIFYRKHYHPRASESLSVMAFLSSLCGYTTAMAIFSVVFFELFYLINGEGFLTSDTVVLNTVTLQCYAISCRSFLELATVCLNQDPCLAMKASGHQDSSGLICTCPSGLAWHATIGRTLFNTTHLRTRKDVTLPGEYFQLYNAFYLKCVE